MSLLLAAPTTAQYGYGSYGYGSYSVGRRLFSSEPLLDSTLQQPFATHEQLFGRVQPGRSLLQAYGAYAYGYGGGYGTGRRLLQTTPGYGYGAGYGYGY